MMHAAYPACLPHKVPPPPQELALSLLPTAVHATAACLAVEWALLCALGYRAYLALHGVTNSDAVWEAGTYAFLVTLLVLGLISGTIMR